MDTNEEFPGRRFLQDHPQAEVSWCARDLHAWRPMWSVQKRQKWLDDHADEIQSAMIDAGHEAISRCLGSTQEEVE